MGRRRFGAAIIGAVLLLDPVTGPRPVVEPQIRLDRASAAVLMSQRGRVPAQHDGAGHDIPLDGDGKHLIVEGRLNDRLSGPMLIDTGASYCVLTADTAERLGLAGRADGSVPVVTANGRVAADLVRLDAMQIRGARLTQVDAVIMDAVEPPLIGIIGLSFLTQFRFSVDLAQGTLRLEP